MTVAWYSMVDSVDLGCADPLHWTGAVIRSAFVSLVALPVTTSNPSCRICCCLQSSCSRSERSDRMLPENAGPRMRRRGRSLACSVLTSITSASWSACWSALRWAPQAPVSPTSRTAKKPGLHFGSFSSFEFFDSLEFFEFFDSFDSFASFGLQSFRYRSNPGVVSCTAAGGPVPWWRPRAASSAFHGR